MLGVIYIFNKMGFLLIKLILGFVVVKKKGIEEEFFNKFYMIKKFFKIILKIYSMV